MKRENVVKLDFLVAMENMVKRDFLETSVNLAFLDRKARRVPQVVMEILVIMEHQETLV